MTVAARAPSIDYLENGGTRDFAVPFRFAAGSLRVSRLRADGVVEALAEGSDYSVVGGETDAGGRVTLTAARSGGRLMIRRVTARVQAMNYTPGDRFPAESHEGVVDRAMLIVQEQDVVIDELETRAVKVPTGETALVLPSLAARRGKLAIFDAFGNLAATTVVPSTDIIDDGFWHLADPLTDDGAWG